MNDEAFPSYPTVWLLWYEGYACGEHFKDLIGIYGSEAKAEEARPKGRRGYSIEDKEVV